MSDRRRCIIACDWSRSQSCQTSGSVRRMLVNPPGPEGSNGSEPLRVPQVNPKSGTSDFGLASLFLVLGSLFFDSYNNSRSVSLGG